MTARQVVLRSFFLRVYRILGSKTKNTVYSSFLSLTVEKTFSYYYLLSLLVPISSYYSFFRGSLYQPGTALDKHRAGHMTDRDPLSGLEEKADKLTKKSSNHKLNP